MRKNEEATGSAQKRWPTQNEDDSIEDRLSQYDYESNEDLTYFESLKRASSSLKINTEGAAAELGPWYPQEQTPTTLTPQTNEIKPVLNNSRQSSASKHNFSILNQMAHKTARTTHNTPINGIKTELSTRDFHFHRQIAARTPIIRPSSSDPRKMRKTLDARLQSGPIIAKHESITQENVPSQELPQGSETQSSEALLSRAELIRETMKIKEKLNRKIRFFHKSRLIRRKPSAQTPDTHQVTQTNIDGSSKYSNLTRLLGDASYDNFGENEVMPRFENMAIQSRIMSPEAGSNKSVVRSIPESRQSMSMRGGIFYSAIPDPNFNATLFGNRLLTRKSQVSISTQRFHSNTDYYNGTTASVVANTESVEEENPNNLKIFGMHQPLGRRSAENIKRKEHGKAGSANEAMVKLFGQQSGAKESRLTNLEKRKETTEEIVREKLETRVESRASRVQPHRSLRVPQRKDDTQEQESIRDTMKILKRINYNSMNKKSVSVESRTTRRNPKKPRVIEKTLEINVSERISNQRPVFFAQTSKAGSNKTEIEGKFFRRN